MFLAAVVDKASLSQRHKLTPRMGTGQTCFLDQLILTSLSSHSGQFEDTHTHAHAHTHTHTHTNTHTHTHTCTIIQSPLSSFDRPRCRIRTYSDTHIHKGRATNTRKQLPVQEYGVDLAYRYRWIWTCMCCTQDNGTVKWCGDDLDILTIGYIQHLASPHAVWLS